jgi:hypothetical protein
VLSRTPGQREENLQAQTGSWSLEKRKETEKETEKMMIERTTMMSEREMRIAIPRRRQRQAKIIAIPKRRMEALRGPKRRMEALEALRYPAKA